MQKMNQRNLTRSRNLRREQTDAERLLWGHLRAKRFQQYHFKRQKVIGPFIVDFFCSKAKLIIELDGGQHNEDSAVKYDLEMTSYLNSRGFKVIRFWNNDMFAEPEAVLTVIGRNVCVAPPSP